MFSFLIKDAFWYQFEFHCPKHLLRVRDLCFLPHLLEVRTSWQEITLQQLSDALEVSPNDLEIALTQPTKKALIQLGLSSSNIV